MDSNTALEGVYAVEPRDLRDAALPADGPANKAAFPFTKGVALLLALLFSLGSWAVILAAIRPLA